MHLRAQPIGGGGRDPGTGRGKRLLLHLRAHPIGGGGRDPGTGRSKRLLLTCEPSPSGAAVETPGAAAALQSVEELAGRPDRAVNVAELRPGDVVLDPG